MIADQKISFEESLRIVRLHREQAQPNIAFSLKLRVWERQQLQLPRTSVKDSIKQLSDVYWNTELEKDAINLIKANVMATKTSEEEFADSNTNIIYILKRKFRNREVRKAKYR